MKLKLLLVSALLLAVGESASATTTVTGTLQNLGTGTVGQGAFVRFWLRGCGGNQPRVNGTAVIAPSQGGVFYFDFTANASGNVSGTLYSTRDVTGLLGGDITCGTSTTSVWYGMQVFVGGKGGPEIPVHALNTATLNISSVTPLTTTPVITAPTGDSTYFRKDAGNSPITGPTQINSSLTVSGTGTFTGLMQCTNFEAVRCVDAANSAGWAGTDVGGWINAAYANLPATGGVIEVFPNTGGGCYNYSTPIVATTAGKYLLLVGRGISTGTNPGLGGGLCLNYTPTTATNAITLDYAKTTDTNPPPQHGIRNLSLINNGCVATDGCGSSANGIVVGTTNAGINQASMEYGGIYGFNVGYTNTNSLSVNVNWLHWMFQAQGGPAEILGGALETNDGSIYAGNGKGIQAQTGTTPEVHWVNVIAFSNAIPLFDFTAVSGTPGTLFLTNCHLENNQAVNPHFITGDVDVVMTNGVMEDSDTTGTGDWMISTTGQDLNIQGTIILSGRTMTQIVIANSPTRGVIQATNRSPSTITTFVTGTNVNFITQEITIAGSSSSASLWLLESPFYTLGNKLGCQITGASCFIDSFGSNSNLQFRVGASPTSVMTLDAAGATSYVGETTAGRGIVPIRGATSQKAETGTADANVLTVTPAAAVGTYRACVVVSVSSATTGVISWTLSWTDSNGNAQANIAQDLFQQGTAAPNTTFTTSAAGNYNGCTTFDVNNAAAAIVIKWVGGGTTAAKVSATVERII